MFTVLLIVIFVFILIKRAYFNKQDTVIDTSGDTTHSLLLRYPKYYRLLQEYLDKFDEIYDTTFVYENANFKTINALFGAKEDVSKQINEISFRLPNDLNEQMYISQLHEDLDSYMNDKIQDAKTRTNIFVNPGNLRRLHRRPFNDFFL